MTATTRMPSSARPAFLRDESPRRNPQAPEPARSTRGHIPGEVGLWVFLLGDMTLFGAFFIGFLAAWRGSRLGFASDASALHVESGALNTVVLLTSSLAVLLALRAMGLGERRKAMTGIIIALFLATTFIGIKASEYVALLNDEHTPTSSSFFTYYFVLTGIHLLHVLVGATVLAVLARRLPRSDPPNGLAFAEGSASYWHMVDALWLVLFPLLYLVPIS
jgi:nitric oxide reductase NorE protein